MSIIFIVSFILATLSVCHMFMAFLNFSFVRIGNDHKLKVY